MPASMYPTVEPSLYPIGTQTWACPRGHCLLVREAPHVVRIVMVDHVDAEAGRSLGRALDEVLKSIRPLHSLWDLEDLTTYDSVVRTEATRVLLANWARVGSVGALALSTVVRMGLTVASIALGNRVRMFSERPPFESYLRELVARR
jgi:hypothetical protein